MSDEELIFASGDSRPIPVVGSPEMLACKQTLVSYGILLRREGPSMQLAPLVSANLMCRELCNRTRLVAGGIVVSVALLPYVALHAAGQQEADALVQQLSGLPAELPSGGFTRLCSPAPAPCPPPPLHWVF